VNVLIIHFIHTSAHCAIGRRHLSCMHDFHSTRQTSVANKWGFALRDLDSTCFEKTCKVGEEGWARYLECFASLTDFN
jgi:hypothetical protein